MDSAVYFNNRLVFETTRKMSNTLFRDYTKQLVDKNTFVYDDPAKINLEGYYEDVCGRIEFLNIGTVNNAYKKYIGKNYHVAMLNFADGVTPGGLVLAGEITQEENICRCTNLYESLTTNVATKKYYQKNKKFAPKYTDTIIYSKHVCIFRDDLTYSKVEPAFSDVITCPAPCGGNSESMRDLLENRMIGIVKSAIVNNTECIILGAWGCGAFGQDVKVIAELFGKVIAKYGKYFELISFAIRDNELESSSIFNLFQVNFWKGFLNG